MKRIKDFFIEATGLTPTPDQENLLHKAITIKEQGHSSYNNILISAGFQSGKTLCSAVIVLWFVFEYGEEVRPLKIILVSAQDNILYFHIREIFKRHPEWVEKLSDKSRLAADLIPLKGFETAKGSIVFVKRATEKQVLGTPADIVVIDEASRVKSEVIMDCLGRLTGDISKFILLSTPDVEDSLFVKWIREVLDKKRKDFKLFTWEATIDKCNWHNEEAEKMKVKEYTKQQYATYVLGRPVKERERSFFPTKHIEECVRLGGTFTGREGGAKSYCEMGIDFGFNRTGLVITERIGTTKRKVLFTKVWKLKSIEVIAPEIGELIKNFSPRNIKVDSKAGINVPVRGQLEKYTNKTITYIDANMHIQDGEGKYSSHKEQMLGQLLRRVREHNLPIPLVYEDLIEEMKKYRKGMQKNDDLIDALALSCYEPSEPITKKHSIVIGFKETDTEQDRMWRR